MIRRNSLAPWARPVLVCLSLAGAVITGYLTVVKLTGGSAACPTAGCNTVLNSRYGEVAGGIPLSLLGLGAYLLVAVQAMWPQWLSDEEARGIWQERAWTSLFWLTTAMTALSGYLIFVLVSDLQVLCLYCIASALLSVGLWLATIFSKPWQDWGRLSFDGILVVLIVIFAAVAVNGTPSSLAAEKANSRPTAAASGGYRGAAIATTATPASIALAQHLSSSGAKMYGAYWCSHCHDQKSLFGAEALADLPYVECDAKGINAQPAECKAAKVDGYPTWIIDSKVLSGTQDLADLADASGYSGSRDFSPAS